MPSSSPIYGKTNRPLLEPAPVGRLIIFDTETTGLLVPNGTRYYTNADPHAFCPRSGESAMYSMDSFTTSAIPLNCDKILRVSPWTFSAPQWHLRSLIILLILCKTKKTQLIFSAKKSKDQKRFTHFSLFTFTSLSIDLGESYHIRYRQPAR